MAFTTVALLGLITHPANMIMTIVPQAMGTLAAFERIQEYLTQESRVEQRRLTESKATDNEPTPIATLDDVTLQPNAGAPPILSDLNINIHKGSIVMFAGPVGSGKTSLLRCLLGELPPTSGTVSVSTMRIAYCDQSPWLPSGTLKQVICGFGPEDDDWYERVINLCCLSEDIATFAHGHHTPIGNRGLNLSGGQRQRLVSSIDTSEWNEVPLIEILGSCSRRL